jgi:hypothetical protein
MDLRTDTSAAPVAHLGLPATQACDNLVARSSTIANALHPISGYPSIRHERAGTFNGQYAEKSHFRSKTD